MGRPLPNRNPPDRPTARIQSSVQIIHRARCAEWEGVGEGVQVGRGGAVVIPRSLMRTSNFVSGVGMASRKCSARLGSQNGFPSGCPVIREPHVFVKAHFFSSSSSSSVKTWPLARDVTLFCNNFLATAFAHFFRNCKGGASAIFISVLPCPL